MAHYMMDIVRRGTRGPTIPQDSKRIAALDDKGAIYEADAIFAGLSAGDPTMIGYRLRKPGRKCDRMVHDSLGKGTS